VTCRQLFSRLFPALRTGLVFVLCAALVGTSAGAAEAASSIPDVFALTSDLPQFQLNPPGKLGRIVDYFNAGGAVRKKGSGEIKPLIILIQDLHAHYGVQKNIAGLLDFLADKLPHPPTSPLPFAVAVEGATGPIDSSLMALFPDKTLKLEASDYLMREGELTGAEFFAIRRSLPHVLTGVEEDRYYTVHRDLFCKTIDDRQELVSSLKEIQTHISKLPRHVFRKNKALWDFQTKVEAYDKGEMSTHEFIGLLMSMASGPAIKKDFPTLASFAANSRFGTMEQIRAATAEFLTQTQNRLSPEEKKDLQLLAKSQGTATYYLYLRDLVYKKQLFLAVPPELAQYLEYIHTAQTMGMDRVVHEAKELAFRLKMKLAQGQEADVVQVDHDLDLLLRLADLQATEYEVRDFAPRLNQFVALTKALLPETFDDAKIRRLISSSIDFYVMALMRNKPMVQNTLALLGPQKTAVLVAGGFHTVELTNLLREKNISYLVMSPTVDKVTEADHALYVKRLSGHYLTTEEIRAGARPLAPYSMARLLSSRTDDDLAYMLSRATEVTDFMKTLFIKDPQKTTQIETYFKGRPELAEAEAVMPPSRGIKRSGVFRYVRNLSILAFLSTSVANAATYVVNAAERTVTITVEAKDHATSVMDLPVMNAFGKAASSNGIFDWFKEFVPFINATKFLDMYHHATEYVAYNLHHVFHAGDKFQMAIPKNVDPKAVADTLAHGIKELGQKPVQTTFVPDTLHQIPQVANALHAKITFITKLTKHPFVESWWSTYGDQVMTWLKVGIEVLLVGAIIFGIYSLISRISQSHASTQVSPSPKDITPTEKPIDVNALTEKETVRRRDVSDRFKGISAGALSNVYDNKPLPPVSPYNMRKRNSGTWSRLRVSMRGNDPVLEESLTDLESRESEFYESAEKESRIVPLFDRTAAREIYADLSEENVSGHHFDLPDKSHLVVLQKGLPSDVEEEVRFQETREIYWDGRGLSPRAAHIRTSYEQAVKFAKGPGQVTAGHDWELAQMNIADLRDLIFEYGSAGRLRHRAIVSQYSSEFGGISEAMAYEQVLYDRALAVLQSKVADTHGKFIKATQDLNQEIARQKFYSARFVITQWFWSRASWVADAYYARREGRPRPSLAQLKSRQKEAEADAARADRIVDETLQIGNSDVQKMLAAERELSAIDENKDDPLAEQRSNLAYVYELLESISLQIDSSLQNRFALAAHHRWELQQRFEQEEQEFLQKNMPHLSAGSVFFGLNQTRMLIRSVPDQEHSYFVVRFERTRGRHELNVDPRDMNNLLINSELTFSQIETLQARMNQERELNRGVEIAGQRRFDAVTKLLNEIENRIPTLNRRSLGMLQSNLNELEPEIVAIGDADISAEFSRVRGDVDLRLAQLTADVQRRLDRLDALAVARKQIYDDKIAELAFEAMRDEVNRAAVEQERARLKESQLSDFEARFQQSSSNLLALTDLIADMVAWKQKNTEDNNAQFFELFHKAETRHDELSEMTANQVLAHASEQIGQSKAIKREINGARSALRNFNSRLDYLLSQSNTTLKQFQDLQVRVEQWKDRTDNSVVNVVLYTYTDLHASIEDAILLKEIEINITRQALADRRAQPNVRSAEAHAAASGLIDAEDQRLEAQAEALRLAGIEAERKALVERRARVNDRSAAAHSAASGLVVAEDHRLEAEAIRLAEIEAERKALAERRARANARSAAAHSAASGLIDAEDQRLAVEAERLAKEKALGERHARANVRSAAAHSAALGLIDAEDQRLAAEAERLETLRAEQLKGADAMAAHEAGVQDVEAQIARNRETALRASVRSVLQTIIPRGGVSAFVDRVAAAMPRTVQARTNATADEARAKEDAIQIQRAIEQRARDLTEADLRIKAEIEAARKALAERRARANSRSGAAHSAASKLIDSEDQRLEAEGKRLAEIEAQRQALAERRARANDRSAAAHTAASGLIDAEDQRLAAEEAERLQAEFDDLMRDIDKAAADKALAERRARANSRSGAAYSAASRLVDAEDQRLAAEAEALRLAEIEAAQKALAERRARANVRSAAAHSVALGSVEAEEQRLEAEAQALRLAEIEAEQKALAERRARTNNRSAAAHSIASGLVDAEDQRLAAEAEAIRLAEIEAAQKALAERRARANARSGAAYSAASGLVDAEDQRLAAEAEAIRLAEIEAAQKALAERRARANARSAAAYSAASRSVEAEEQRLADEAEALRLAEIEAQQKALAERQTRANARSAAAHTAASGLIDAEDQRLAAEAERLEEQRAEQLKGADAMAAHEASVQGVEAQIARNHETALQAGVRSVLKTIIPRGRLSTFMEHVVAALPRSAQARANANADEARSKEDAARTQSAIEQRAKDLAEADLLAKAELEAQEKALAERRARANARSATAHSAALRLIDAEDQRLVAEAEAIRLAEIEAEQRALAEQRARANNRSAAAHSAALGLIDAEDRRLAAEAEALRLAEIEAAQKALAERRARTNVRSAAAHSSASELVEVVTENIAKATKAFKDGAAFVPQTAPSDVNQDQLDKWNAHLESWEDWAQSVGILGDSEVQTAIGQFKAAITAASTIMTALSDAKSATVTLKELAPAAATSKMVAWGFSVRNHLEQTVQGPYQTHPEIVQAVTDFRKALDLALVKQAAYYLFSSKVSLNAFDTFLTQLQNQDPATFETSWWAGFEAQFPGIAQWAKTTPRDAAQFFIKIQPIFQELQVTPFKLFFQGQFGEVLTFNQYWNSGAIWGSLGAFLGGVTVDPTAVWANAFLILAQKKFNHFMRADHPARVSKALLSQEDALAQGQRYLDAIEKGRAENRGYQVGQEVIVLDPNVETYIITDTHQHIEYLQKALYHRSDPAGPTLLEKMIAGTAVFKVVGDAVHPESGDYRDVIPSEVEMQFIKDLKIRFPRNFYFELGDHEFFEGVASKGAEPQGWILRDFLLLEYGPEYLELYRKALERSPISGFGKGYADAHAGPFWRDASERSEHIPIQDVQADQQNMKLRRATWGRPEEWAENQRERLRQRYKDYPKELVRELAKFNAQYDKLTFNKADVDAHLAAVGQPDGVFIGGHTYMTDNPDEWHFQPASISNLHIISAARRRGGVAVAKDGKVDYYDITDVDVPADFKLPEPKAEAPAQELEQMPPPTQTPPPGTTSGNEAKQPLPKTEPPSTVAAGTPAMEPPAPKPVVSTRPLEVSTAHSVEEVIDFDGKYGVEFEGTSPQHRVRLSIVGKRFVLQSVAVAGDEKFGEDYPIVKQPTTMGRTEGDYIIQVGGFGNKQLTFKISKGASAGVYRLTIPNVVNKTIAYFIEPTEVADGKKRHHEVTELVGNAEALLGLMRGNKIEYENHNEYFGKHPFQAPNERADELNKTLIKVRTELQTSVDTLTPDQQTRLEEEIQKVERDANTYSNDYKAAIEKAKDYYRELSDENKRTIETAHEKMRTVLDILSDMLMVEENLFLTDSTGGSDTRSSRLKALRDDVIQELGGIERYTLATEPVEVSKEIKTATDFDLKADKLVTRRETLYDNYDRAPRVQYPIRDDIRNKVRGLFSDLTNAELDALLPGNLPLPLYNDKDVIRLRTRVEDLRIQLFNALLIAMRSSEKPEKYDYSTVSDLLRQLNEALTDFKWVVQQLKDEAPPVDSIQTIVRSEEASALKRLAPDLMKALRHWNVIQAAFNSNVQRPNLLTRAIDFRAQFQDLQRALNVLRLSWLQNKKGFPANKDLAESDLVRLSSAREYIPKDSAVLLKVYDAFKLMVIGEYGKSGEKGQSQQEMESIVVSSFVEAMKRPGMSSNETMRVEFSALSAAQLATMSPAEVALYSFATIVIPAQEQSLDEMESLGWLDDVTRPKYAQLKTSFSDAIEARRTIGNLIREARKAEIEKVVADSVAYSQALSRLEQEVVFREKGRLYLKSVLDADHDSTVSQRPLETPSGQHRNGFLRHEGAVPQTVLRDIVIAYESLIGTKHSKMKLPIQDIIIRKEVLDGRVRVIGVADGHSQPMGGDVAAKRAQEIIENAIQKLTPADIINLKLDTGEGRIAYMNGLGNEIVDALKAHARQFQHFNGMGTTLSFVLVVDEDFSWTATGNTKIILHLNNDKAEQVSLDHIPAELGGSPATKTEGLKTTSIHDKLLHNSGSMSLRQVKTILIASDGIIGPIDLVKKNNSLREIENVLRSNRSLVQKIVFLGQMVDAANIAITSQSGRSSDDRAAIALSPVFVPITKDGRPEEDTTERMESTTLADAFADLLNRLISPGHEGASMIRHWIWMLLGPAAVFETYLVLHYGVSLSHTFQLAPIVFASLAAGVVFIGHWLQLLLSPENKGKPWNQRTTNAFTWPVISLVVMTFLMALTLPGLSPGLQDQRILQATWAHQFLNMFIVAFYMTHDYITRGPRTLAIVGAGAHALATPGQGGLDGSILNQMLPRATRLEVDTYRTSLTDRFVRAANKAIGGQA